MDGTQRLQRLASAREEQVIDLQQVHAQGKHKDTRAARGGQHDAVSAEQEQSQAN